MARLQILFIFTFRKFLSAIRSILLAAGFVLGTLSQILSAPAAPRVQRPDLVTVLQEASLYYDLKNVSDQLANSAATLLENPTLENHQVLANALRFYLKKKGYLTSQALCAQTCYVTLLPKKSVTPNDWLQASTNRLAIDKIIPATLGFDTSFITDQSAYFDSQTSPARVGLDWVDLATSVMSSVTGHELRHWKHEQIRRAARLSSNWRKAYKDLLQTSGFLPAAALSNWRKGIQYFNPEIEKIYGRKDGFSIEEADTNFYNARREITFAQRLWNEKVYAKIGEEKAWELSEIQISTALQYFEISEALLRVSDLILEDFLGQIQDPKTTFKVLSEEPDITVEVTLPSSQNISFPIELFIERKGTSPQNLKGLVANELLSLKNETQKRSERNLAFYRELIAFFKERHPFSNQPTRLRKALKDLLVQYPDIVEAYDHSNISLPARRVRNRPTN